MKRGSTRLIYFHTYHTVMLSKLRTCRPPSSRLFSSISNSKTPWFVDDDPVSSRQQPQNTVQPIIRENSLPPELPPHLVKLHEELSRSPHLEPGNVEVRPPLPTEPGPPLPSALPKGRRRRGRTDFGLGVPDTTGGLWKWIVIAQVRYLLCFSKKFEKRIFIIPSF